MLRDNNYLKASVHSYSDIQKSVPIKPVRVLPSIAVGCFNSHPLIDGVLQKSGFRYGLLENAVYHNSLASSHGEVACRLVAVVFW